MTLHKCANPDCQVTKDDPFYDLKIDHGFFCFGEYFCRDCTHEALSGKFIVRKDFVMDHKKFVQAIFHSNNLEVLYG